MRFARSGCFLFTGLAIGNFITGLYSDDSLRLTLSFICLVTAWVLREANLGWKGKGWAFLPWTTESTDKKGETA